MRASKRETENKKGERKEQFKLKADRVCHLAGEEGDGNFEHGFLLYGVPVGSDTYCSHKLMEIARRIQEDGQKTAALLSSDRQALWSALRCSIAQRFDYWLQLSYPICGGSSGKVVGR